MRSFSCHLILILKGTIMQIDEEVIISATGRQVIEDRLRLLLVDRENCRAAHAQAVRQAYGSQESIIHTQPMCDHLCVDLGYASEGEAIALLLGAKQTGRYESWSAPCNEESAEEPQQQEARR